VLHLDIVNARLGELQKDPTIERYRSKRSPKRQFRQPQQRRENDDDLDRSRAATIV